MDTLQQAKLELAKRELAKRKAVLPPNNTPKLNILGGSLGLNTGFNNVIGGVDDIANSAKSGFEKSKAGYEQSKNAENVGDLLEGAVKFGSGAVDTLLSPLAPVMKPVKTVIDTAGKTIGNIPAVQKFATSKAGKITERAVEDVADINNIAGAVAGFKTLPEVQKSIVNTAKDVKDTLSNIRETVNANKINKIIKNRADELYKIETGYAKTRKIINRSKDSMNASRERVSNTDVLANSVSKDGVIQTKQKGGAVEQYKDLTLNKKEGLVRNDLEREGASVSPEVVRAKLKSNIMNSGLEGKSLQTALNNIDSEINGLMLRAGEDGKIPLTSIQDAKVNTTNTIDYNNPATKIEAKAIGNAYKKVIEETSSLPISEVNAELGKYLQDIEYLSNLDGLRVKGGRLGKYFSQLSGNIIGATAGSVLGPAGSAAGTILGGELGGRIRANALSKTLGGKTGNIPAKNVILEEALKRSKSPRLALPAPAEGSPKIKIESGKTINLPPKTQTTVDENLFKKFR